MLRRCCREVDKLEWILSKTQGFWVKSYCNALRGWWIFSLVEHLDDLCTAKGGFFFSWCVVRKDLDYKYSKGVRVIIMDWCFMCKSHGESVAHLFRHCVVARELWSLVFCLFCVSWVMPYFVSELLSCWKRRFGNRSNGEIWKADPLCLLWYLWRERNAGCFEGKELHMSKLKILFFEDFIWVDFDLSYFFYCRVFRVPLFIFVLAILYILPMCWGCASFVLVLLMDLLLLIKKTCKSKWEG